MNNTNHIKNKPSYSYDYSGNNRVHQDGRSRTAHRTVVRFVKLLDVIMVSLPFITAWALYFSHKIFKFEFYRRGNWLVIALFVILYYLLSHLYSGYTIHISRISEIVYSQTLGVLITDSIMFIIMWLLFRSVPNILIMLLVLLAQFLLIIIWSFCSHHWYIRNNPPTPTAIIYDGFEGVEKLVAFYGMTSRFAVIKKVSISELHGEDWDALSRNQKAKRERQRIGEVLNDVGAVFLCSLHSHDRNQIVKHCVHKDIVSWCIPRIGDVIMASAEKAHLFHLPMLRVGRYNPTPEYLVLKRLFDIVVSCITLVLLSPLMAVIALLIRMDGGTALYRQKRLTKDGKVFELLKFRSMKMNAESDGVARLSSGENDPRITKIGKFIRSCRIDELPQLINILKGDMSIVGPRPERPEIAEQYKKNLPEFDLRLQCKCGLTGFAQVFGKYNTTPYDKLLMDLMYIAQPSIVEDLRICFATIKILFLPESTEGVAAGATTAMYYENAADSTENDAEAVIK